MIKFWAHFICFIFFHGNLHALTYVFAHGLGGNSNQAYYYQPLKASPEAILQSFDFPHVKSDKTIDATKVSLGQELEIQALHEICKSIEDEKIIIGVSMGAATAFNYAALNSSKEIKALILESPFDAPETVIAQRIQNLNLSYIPGIQAIGNLIVTQFMYPSYNPKGIKPITIISLIDTAIPILFIHSKKDTLIPVSASRNLYSALRKVGHGDVYLLELEEGEHADCIGSVQGRIYRAVVHAFYQKYNLPHNETWAQEGASLLASCQPDIENIPFKNLRAQPSSLS